MLKTTKEITFRWRLAHKVTIPAGTRLREIKCYDGLDYAVEPDDVLTDSPKGSWTTWQTDTTHYYIFAPREVWPDGLADHPSTAKL